METLQIYEQGRSSSAVDITCNTAGAALGVMLAAITRRVSVPDRLLICHLPVYVPQLILGVTAFAFLWPFHFTPVPNPVSLVPFALLISGDGPRGLLAMGQTLAAAVISIWSLRASGRSLAWSTLIAAAVMCGIETGRIFIPGASPGTTNPLLVLLTGYALGGVEFESGSGWGKATNR